MKRLSLIIIALSLLASISADGQSNRRRTNRISSYCTTLNGAQLGWAVVENWVVRDTSDAVVCLNSSLSIVSQSGTKTFGIEAYDKNYTLLSVGSYSVGTSFKKCDLTALKDIRYLKITNLTGTIYLASATFN